MTFTISILSLKIIFVVLTILGVVSTFFRDRKIKMSHFKFILNLIISPLGGFRVVINMFSFLLNLLIVGKNNTIKFYENVAEHFKKY